MHGRGRTWVAGLLLAALVGAAAWGSVPGLLSAHEVPVAGSQLGSVPGGLPDAGSVTGSAPGVPSAPGASSYSLPAPAVGLPLSEAPGLPAAVASLPGALARQAGGPHDALLAATGSASGLGIAYLPDMGDPAAFGAGAPGTPLGVLDVANLLASKRHDARSDAQSLLLDAARAAGIPVRRAAYAHGLGPDALERAVLELYDAVGVRITAEQRVQLHEDASSLDGDLRDGVALILFALADAQRSMTRVLGSLDPDAFQLLWSCAKPTDDPEGASCADPFRAGVIAETQLDRKAVFQAALGVLSAVEQAMPTLQAAADGALARSSRHTGSGSGPQDGPDIFADPTRLIQIGSTGDDVYYGNLLGEAVVYSSTTWDSKAQLFTLDLSGNDLYLNRAGGTVPNPVATSQDSETLAPAADAQFLLGALVSLSIDLGGNDAYSGGAGAQGSGTLGIGVLLDLGGADTYTASSVAQGAGSSGIGLLVDAAGDDSYASSYRSQGYGTLGGLGMLVEVDGNDGFSGTLLVQGAGSIQGFGMLVNVNGNDAYSAVNVGPSLSQGVSHLLAVGVFADGTGIDSYTTSGGSRGHILPAPPPWGSGVAIFLDRGMLDSYSGGYGLNGATWTQGALGLGLDRS